MHFLTLTHNQRYSILVWITLLCFSSKLFAQLDVNLTGLAKDSAVLERNVLRVAIQANDVVLVNNEESPFDSISTFVKRHLLNYGLDTALSEIPQKAIVSLTCKRETTYKRYVEVYEAIRDAYLEVRNEVSLERYRLAYNELSDKQKKRIRQEIPMRISEAEPSGQ